MLEHVDLWLRVVIGIGAVVGLVAGYFRWAVPRMQRNEAMSDAMLGRPEVKDRSGAVVQPSQPGMPARVAELADAVKELVQMQHRVDKVEAEQNKLAARVDDLEGVTSQLQQAHLERIVSRVESTQAWGAIEAAAKATPPDEP